MEIKLLISLSVTGVKANISADHGLNEDSTITEPEGLMHCSCVCHLS